MERNTWVQMIASIFVNCEPWTSYSTCHLLYLPHCVVLNHTEYILLELLKYCLAVSNIELLIISYSFFVNIIESYPNIPFKLKIELKYCFMFCSGKSTLSALK